MTLVPFLSRLIRYRPALYTLVLLLSLASAAVALVPGFLARAFFDTLTGSAAAGLDVNGIAALVVAVAVATVALRLSAALADTRFRFMASTLVHHNLLRHVLGRPGARALPCSPGEAINHFRDDVDAIEFQLRALANDIPLSFSTIAAMAIMVTISPTMAVSVVLPIAIVLAVARFFSSRVGARREDSRKTTARFSGILGEALGNVLAVQIAGAEGRILKHFERIGEERKRAAMRDILLGCSVDAAYSVLGTLALGAMLLVGAALMGGGHFSVGDFALFVSLTDILTGFTWRAGNAVAEYKRTGVSFGRLREILQGDGVELLVEPRDLGLGSDRRAPLYSSGRAARPAPAGRDGFERLEVRGLCYRYPRAGVEALARRGIESVSFELRRGEIAVITGRIGSGKTTLVRALLGLLPRDAGEISWNGEPVADPASFFVPPRTAYTAQSPTLFSESVEDNVLMGMPEDAGFAAALRAAVLEADLAEMPQGTRTVIGPKGIRVSGGQRQRMAAARMFVRSPELLVFDDLSSALDIETEMLLWERLRERKGASCLLVSHRRPVLSMADRIIVMEEGRVVAEGKLEALLQSSPAMRSLWQEERGKASP